MEVLREKAKAKASVKEEVSYYGATGMRMAGSEVMNNLGHRPRIVRRFWS